MWTAVGSRKRCSYIQLVVFFFFCLFWYLPNIEQPLTALHAAPYKNRRVDLRLERPDGQSGENQKAEEENTTVR